MYLDTGNKIECTGCTACKEVCGHNAITMIPDEEGFLYPIIDNLKCVECGLCRKVCPVEHPKYECQEDPLVYVNNLKDIDQRKKSSSGGLFYAIAHYVISHGGIVVGAAFDENLQLIHKVAETSDELNPLRGSKYVQSNLQDIFIKIRENLKEGKYVYFTGTPCQVAGLKSFLIKEYSNLLTSDLICHGVPSQKMLDWHIKFREEQFKDKITKIQFRDNASWGVCEILDFANRKQYRAYSYDLSPYLFPFMYGYNYRPACYECPFAKIPRQGDITLGDFWGVKKLFPNFDYKHGVSIAIVNTEKGERIWSLIKENLNWSTSNIKDGSKENGNILRPTIRPICREGIYERVQNKGYDVLARTEFRCQNYSKLKLRYNIVLFLNKIGLLQILKRVLRR